MPNQLTLMKGYRGYLSLRL